VKISVECVDGRVRGSAPLGKGTFVARELRPSADLSALDFKELELSVPLSAGISGLHVEAQAAVVRGLSPWGRPRNSSLVLRVVSIWAATLLTSALAAALALRTPGRLRVVIVGLVAGLSLALTLLALDRGSSSTPWLALGLLPLAGAAGVTLAAMACGLGETLLDHARALALRRRRLRLPPPP
ncbi:MAG TPA: hypothetical protein VGP93_07415, partial [Polyangiaceae bacterium]|nr:hypothetical protein [Polyangiaceae bacterium]